MGKYISFSNYNKNYKYIIFSCIFNYLTYFITGEDLKEIIISLNIINKDTRSLSIHAVIIDIFNYLGIIIISSILYKFKEKKLNTNNQNNDDLNNKSSELSLIYYDINEEINENISILNFILLNYLITIIILGN